MIEPCTLGIGNRAKRNRTFLQNNLVSLIVCHSLCVVFIRPHLFNPTSYDCLLCAPSFSMPSQPAAFPANSSTLPKPSRLASRFWLAAFIASMPEALSLSAETFQVSEPVTAPIADYKKKCQIGV
jgi:hypothetical protein